MEPNEPPPQYVPSNVVCAGIYSTEATVSTTGFLRADFFPVAQFATRYLLLASTTRLGSAQSVDPQTGIKPETQGATTDVTHGAGPNGSEDWFNTGLHGNSQALFFFYNFTTMYHIDRPTFKVGAGSNFRQYDQYFQIGGDSRGIDPTILAFIAMQESSCQASVGGPRAHLMKVSYANHPNGIRTDSIQDNVSAGANYLQARMRAGQGLNGSKDLTESYPCSSEGMSNGLPQNLDYIQETFNGWFTGQNAYGNENWVGTHKCKGSCGG